MVMEIPTPQCVGREFVRQYYTLLNKAPLHLHRFYNHDSSFLHGGLDRPGQETRPVVGQQDIHERIMQLNFRDCHAKIRQVDSQETLSDGVVVQVSGELSNNGLPMRRFMQTFVLVPQSPKKYYVRNDIFRYQDEIFTEDDIDLDEEQPIKTMESSATEDDTEYLHHENEIVRNGSMYATEPVMVPPKYSSPTAPKYPSPTAPPVRESAPSPSPGDAESTKSDWEEDEEEDVEAEEEEEVDVQVENVVERHVEEAVQQPTAQEPKTYANMVSKNTSGHIPLMPSNISPSALPPLQKPDHGPLHKVEASPISGPQQGGFGGRPSRPRLNSGRGNRFEPDEARSPEETEEGRRGSRGQSVPSNFQHYSDAQQLFVGNLTHAITEEDLRNFFQQYGKVLDIRISVKPPQKIGGVKVPNFGFIVFENPDSVQAVLKLRPIYLNEHRLNVEEKKRPGLKENRIMAGPPRGGPPPRAGVGGPRRGPPPLRPDNRGGLLRGGGFAPRR